jgi:hypothetical protein
MAVFLLELVLNALILGELEADEPLNLALHCH